ncbi:unnamed protein product [Penicillium camemberti]|uniref:Str. FM013 n=1 Tax=Penicillium camemberti (strain FM 013) TaxID=1429867 RepID=A0A0G4PNR9_PENC3|nr:unnamed protein product [Penicillium camemberti]
MSHPGCQFLPKRLPCSRTTKWPSLVVETGFSETPSKLTSDAEFWLSESNGDVQMSWELVDDRVKCQQVITINKGQNNSQPLVIRFDKLFLRPPTIPRETNISIDNTILNEIASEIWEEQSF